MSSKKHLDGQGQARRRNNRRRAVHLSEFLRDDDEPTVQDPAPQADYQNTTENSIGTISSTDLSASCVTVSPIVTPDTPTDEPKKVAQSPPPPPAPPTPVNVWQLSSGEKDPPQGTFMPDHKEFPSLGKQERKCKPLVPVPEANNSARSSDSAKARRVCHVLGNFLSKSMLPERTSGKDQTVASWLSSVRSALDRYQDTKPSSCSPPRITNLKRATSQQSPGCFFELNVPAHPEISYNKPASRVAAAAASVPKLEKGPSQQKQPRKIPENSNENNPKQKCSVGPSNPAARETKPLEEVQAGEKDKVPASQFSTKDERQNLGGNRSFWEESDESSLEEQTVNQAGERETTGGVLPPIHCSSLNSSAQEFRPIVGEQEGEQEQRFPGGGQLSETRLMRRRRLQRSQRTLKRRHHAHLNWSQLFENQAPVQGQMSQQQAIERQRKSEGQQQEQSQASIALPAGCYYSAPAAAHQQAAPVTQKQPATPPFHGAPPTTPVFVAVPATPPAVAHSSQTPIISQNNADVSQSLFRMACLPSTSGGTRDAAPADISSVNQLLPSSISGASQFTHTLSSLPPVEGNYPHCRRQQSVISPDLFYNRSLMDMDREDTQEEEEEEQASAHQQSGSQLNSDRNRLETEREQPPAIIDLDSGVVPSDRKLIFQSPSAHGEGYPQPDLNFVPANIKKLHKTITVRYSDYAFVYALSAQLGQECVPMDCYVYLKMVLLASIVSIEPDELRPPISLCIIATDSLMANRLMNCLGQLAPRFLGPHEYGLQPAISGGQLSSSRYAWVVASPLLLAQQGVYYAGDWTRLSKEQGEQIEKCIENGSVPVPQLQSEQALEAAIWTHWQPENSSNQTLAFAKLCPIFGMPIYMGQAAAGSNSDSLWSFLLRQHSEPESEDEQPDGLHIPEEDIRLLLHLLHQRQITFEDGAQHMLQKYFVISRKERPTVFHSKTYIVLKQFAESFAKLALRLEVLESDVCLAIFHCEHFVQQIFGATQPPPPAVTSFGVISHIDPYMNVFGRWLQQYLDRYDDQELGMDKAKRRRTDSWEFL